MVPDRCLSFLRVVQEQLVDLDEGVRVVQGGAVCCGEGTWCDRILATKDIPARPRCHAR